jgi:hypothetical protein
MGSPMILTCMNRIKNPQKYEIKHIYCYEGNTDPDEVAVYGIQSKSGKRVFVAVLLQIYYDAAQVPINISIKTNKKNRISNLATQLFSSFVFITLKRNR